MRPIAFVFLISALVSGQPTVEPTVDRVLYFAHTESEQSIQEIATLIRTIAEIRAASADTAKRSLTLRGTSGQMGLAEWLFTQLDQPGPNPSPAPHQYRFGNDDLVRVFYLTHTATVQEFQEVAALTRTMADIRWVFTYNAPRALVVRGTVDQIALADWLVKQVDKPTGERIQSSAPYEYRDPNGRDDNVVRVFYLTHTTTVQDFQEVAVLTRSIADIRRVFTCNAPRALAVRGTADQVALAEWLVNQLDQPAHEQSSAPYEYRAPVVGDGNVVRIFYLTHTATVEDFQTIATQIRKETSIRRVYTYNAPRALALRGTANQMAIAEHMIKNLD
jgi:hypothetical protein